MNRLAKVVIGGALVLATPEHPFYANGQYIPAMELHVGDSVHTISDKKEAVSSVQIIDTTAVVYNLEVANQHNYFIGHTGLLVHNSCALKTIYSRISDQAQRNAFKNQLRAIGGKTSERSALIERIAGLSPPELSRFLADFNTGTVEFASVFSKYPKAFDAYSILGKGLPQYSKSASDVADLAKDLARYDDEFSRLLRSDGKALSLWDLARKDVRAAAEELADLSIEDRRIFEALLKHEKFVQEVLPLFTKGTDFEAAMNRAVIDESSSFWKRLSEELGIKSEDFNPRDYEVFEQVQLKTGNKIDDAGKVYKNGTAIPNGVVVKDEYFIADFVLVKKIENLGVEALDFNNAIVLETKLNEATALSTRQNHGLEVAKNGGTLSSRSSTLQPVSKAGSDPDAQHILKTGESLQVSKWIKVWSDGTGQSFSNLKSLK